MDKIAERAEKLLSRAEEAAKSDFDAMFAKQAASGTAGSGKTIILATDLYQRRLAEALTQLQGEIGNQIDHRGRKWRAAIGSVQQALTAVEARSEAIFEPVWRVSRATDSAIRAGETRRAKAFDELREQVGEFGEGWTAPRPKAWHERHPLLYGSLTTLAGAILGWIGNALAG